jgi:bifunctional DNA-binding transcriptional regulator/antitoxin component of YhaV-PrlF toxin-antitoxin module
MNQVQVNTNIKGQFVIPIAMRRYWEITDQTPLNVTNIPDLGILIKPSPKTPPMTDEEYLQILEETQGSWKNDDWEETEKKLDKLATLELKEQKKDSW